MKNGIRVTICVMMIVTVLAMSLSVFATDTSPSPVPTLPPDPLDPVIEGIVNHYVWLMLNSWGIEISEDGAAGFTDSVNAFLEEQLQEFVDSIPSIYSISTFIAPWQADFDYWGNMRFNSKMTEDVTMFAQWLETKYGLHNNSEQQVIVPVSQLGGVIVYNTPVAFYTRNGVHVQDIMQVIPYNCSIMMVHGNTNINQDVLGYYIISESENAQVVQREYRNNGTYTDSTLTVIYPNSTDSLFYRRSTSTWYYSDIDTSMFSVYRAEDTVGIDNIGVPTTTAFFDSFNHIEEVGTSVSILTSLINLPPDDENYTPGDSITIVDNQPLYEEITWPDSVVVSNLPAIVSTGTISNPGLETFWGFIPVLAEQTKDAIVLARGLIYELPEEVVVTFYAVMGGLILFGIIKLMREH